MYECVTPRAVITSDIILGQITGTDRIHLESCAPYLILIYISLGHVSSALGWAVFQALTARILSSVEDELFGIFALLETESPGFLRMLIITLGCCPLRVTCHNSGAISGTIGYLSFVMIFTCKLL